MKKLLKMFGNLNQDRRSKVPFLIIALVAAIGFSMAACSSGDEEDDDDSINPSTTYNKLIDGVWKDTDGWQYSVNNGTATISTMGSMNTLWTNAVNKNYVKLGAKYCQNIKSTGNLTWSGQFLTVTYNTASPNTATGTSWRDCTLTMSSNQQTVTLSGSDSTTAITETWTRGSVYTLIGVWEPEDGDTRQITVYDGSSGYFTRMGSGDLVKDAIKKGYVKNGDQCWRKLVNDGNVKWTGEVLLYGYNTNAPKVCTGVSWHSVTLTLSSDGRTLGWYAPASSTPTDTFIRKK
jgi:hypothetical protein